MLLRPLRVQLRPSIHVAYAFYSCSFRRLATHSISQPSISDILALRPKDGQGATRIDVVGFVRTIRNQKHRSFVHIGDGSTIHSLQAILEPDQAQGLSTGTSVAITGLWHPCPPQKEQAYELRAEHVEIIGVSDPEKYSIQKKYHTSEFLRSLPHLRLRIPSQALIARLRSECQFFISQFFRCRDFIHLQPPIITSSDCEGAGKVFTVTSEPELRGTRDINDQAAAQDGNFFGKPKYLTVSSQLHLEAFVHEHPKVWTFSPTFRAEQSDTPRHVSEFWMLEVEFQTKKLDEITGIVEDSIKSLVNNLRGSTVEGELIAAVRRSDDLEAANLSKSNTTLQHRWDGLVRQSWHRISYEDAIRLLKDAADSNATQFDHQPSWSTGLHSEHERFIATEVGRGSPVFVTNYPETTKPFYMLPSKMDPTHSSSVSQTVECFDLLFPEVGEVAGGSLREHRLVNLLQSMQRHGVNYSSQNLKIGELDHPAQSNEPGPLDWYVDLRRYGSIPHGGFGLGFDRLLCYLSGTRNIRDVIPWPRYFGRCDC